MFGFLTMLCSDLFCIRLQQLLKEQLLKMRALFGTYLLLKLPTKTCIVVPFSKGASSLCCWSREQSAGPTLAIESD